MSELSVIRASKEKAKRNRDNWKARCERMEGMAEAAVVHVRLLLDNIEAYRETVTHDDCSKRLYDEMNANIGNAEDFLTLDSKETP